MNPEQIDTDWTGTGGVTPGIRVPLARANARAVFVDGTDIVLDAAVDHLETRVRESA